MVVVVMMMIVSGQHGTRLLSGQVYGLEFTGLHSIFYLYVYISMPIII